MNSEDESAIRTLYANLLRSWNNNDARGFAADFAPNGRCIGFDGSEYGTAQEAEEQLQAIFKDHTVASYVGKVREVTPLTPDVAVLRAVAGMIPPGGDDLNPERNAVQILVAVKQAGKWQIVLYQNTPAQYDGRPEAAQELTNELQALRSKS